MQKHIRLFATVVVISSVSVACSSGSGARVAQVVPPTPPAAQVSAAPLATTADPVQELLTLADRHFDVGRSELSLGHFARAKAAFNTALEVLLESPQGARGEPRLRDHFDRLVDRIAALELSALATGDGFTEQKAEPASIDELLAINTFDTTPPTAATADSVQADLEETEHDIPIPLNDRVLRYVELFQGRLRDYLTAGLSRGAQYLPMIQDVFRAEGLPLDLAYVPLIESAFKPTALSRAKAKGVWQFMPPTGREYGLKQDWYIDERSDPAKATIAAAKYFKSLYRMFDDWHLAMASYNGGPGRMQRAINKSGLDDFWSLTETSDYLPRETRDYVPMILAAVIIAKNPVKYGFDIIPTEAPATASVSVPAAVDLRRVAEWAGVAADDIQKLNPELRRWTTPIRGQSYDLKIPAASADRVRDELHEANTRELNALQWHVVKRGETLATIARKLRVNRTDLAEANYLRMASKVTSGQRLLIPRMPSAALLARGGTAIPAGAVADDTTADTQSEDTARLVHRVKAGETLYSIARKYQTTVESVKSVNNLRRSALKVGTRLTIQTGRSVATQQQ
ncbi:MAG TPA: transglycosylase SLT domain-containing protein [Vicinamibacterales bacterium]|nr:transglycosylase SLT domain-containing protein [Vicinamibacterales bacterium]